MFSSLHTTKNTTRGFTLIELLVVVAIIGTLASVVLASLNQARASAEDTRRQQDMREIRKALELFHQKYGHYPDNANNSVSNGGECIGVGDDIDRALEEFINPVPIDPKHDVGDCTPFGGTSGNFFYAYDPQHAADFCNGDTSDDLTNVVVFGFNHAQVTTSGLQKDTCTGSNMNLHNADFNMVLTN